MARMDNIRLPVACAGLLSRAMVVLPVLDLGVHQSILE
jgi:hypothetical protein